MKNIYALGLTSNITKVTYLIEQLAISRNNQVLYLANAGTFPFANVK
jgi:hypothetical protein